MLIFRNLGTLLCNIWENLTWIVKPVEMDWFFRNQSFLGGSTKSIFNNIKLIGQFEGDFTPSPRSLVRYRLTPTTALIVHQSFITGQNQSFHLFTGWHSLRSLSALLVVDVEKTTNITQHLAQKNDPQHTLRTFFTLSWSKWPWFSDYQSLQVQ